MDDVKSISYSPQQAGRLSLEMIDMLRKDAGGGIPSGIADMDKMLLPFRPGELITVLGFTSNYKSGFMNWLSKQALKSIVPESNEIVIRVTWEQSVEEDTLSWLAGESNLSITNLARGFVDESEWKILQQSAVKRAITPMWIVGHSQKESKERRRTRPRMTMPDVNNAIEYILNDAAAGRFQPRMIVLDYLQRIRPHEKDGSTKREQMMEAVNHSKDMAISFGCPVVLGVQTGRQVLERDNKIPTIEDGQETSNVEQSSDKMFGLWYPIKTESEDKKYFNNDINIPITKNLLIVRLLKQKLGEAPKTFRLHVDPERNIISGTTSQQK